MALPKILYSTTLVRFQDCDPYGHLYNSKYLDYFMNAREDQVLEHYGMDIYSLAGTEGVGWVVAQNQIAYLEPAMLMERVEITTKILNYSPGTIRVEFQMLRDGGDRLKALMWSSFVHFDLKTRSAVRHRPEFMDMFSGVHHPVEEQRFEDRVQTFRQKKAASGNT